MSVGFAQTAAASSVITFEFNENSCVETDDILHPNWKGKSDGRFECKDGKISTSRTYEDTSETHQAKVSGYSNTVGDENKVLELTKTTQWSGGIGIKNEDRCERPGNTDLDSNEYRPPEHAVDNNERIEIVEIDMHMLFNVTSVEIGWIDWDGPGGGDADFTLLAYDPLLGAPTLSGLEAYSGDPGGQNLTDNGWQIIGSYDADSVGWENGSYKVNIETDVVARY